MATVKEVTIDALEDILEQSAEEPIEPEDGEVAIRYLNDMMAMWAALGISLGYTRVSNMGQEVTIPPGALSGVKALLSISLAPKFDATISPGLLQRAKDGWRAIRNLVIKQTQRQYPSILPVGSGNSYPSFTSSAFFPNLEDAILTEVGGHIALEINTEG